MQIPERERRAGDLYLDLLKKCLTRVLFPDRRLGYDLAPVGPADLAERAEGRDWPSEAETMIGLRRLDNLQACIAEVIEQDVPGVLMETGVWRGGASIFMRAALKAYGDQERLVWLADSFQGLPEPDPARYPLDEGDPHHRLAPYLGVSLEEVKTNFERYGLLDERVHFLPGWFKDTLSSAPLECIAVLRIDGDMYESTMEALIHLYHKVSEGGFVIVDDYGALPNCRAAVEDFRKSRGILETVERIDWTGVYWRKSQPGAGRA
jgi:O-methyltransferase